MAGIFRTILASIFIALTLVGCATIGPESEIEKLDYRSRAASRSDGAVLVSASVLSADESRDVYGVPLADKGIQPVWIEVENGDDAAYWLLSPGLDPNFFPPSEAAEAPVNETRMQDTAHTRAYFDSARF